MNSNKNLLFKYFMFANIERSLFSNITYISTVITKNLYNRIYKMICKKILL